MVRKWDRSTCIVVALLGDQVGQMIARILGIADSISHTIKPMYNIGIELNANADGTLQKKWLCVYYTHQYVGMSFSVAALTKTSQHFSSNAVEKGILAHTNRKMQRERESGIEYRIEERMHVHSKNAQWHVIISTNSYGIKWDKRPASTLFLSLSLSLSFIWYGGWENVCAVVLRVD